MAVQPRDRRKRFKSVVVTILGLHVGFLLVLLGQGFRAETITAAARTITEPAEPSASPSGQPPAVQAKPVLTQAGTRAPATKASAPSPRSTVTPTASAAAGQAPTNAPGLVETIHTVRSGDTLNGLARLYGTSTQAIRAANGLSSDRLTVGAKLKIPAAK